MGIQYKFRISQQLRKCQQMNTMNPADGVNIDQGRSKPISGYTDVGCFQKSKYKNWSYFLETATDLTKKAKEEVNSDINNIFQPLLDVKKIAGNDLQVSNVGNGEKFEHAMPSVGCDNAYSIKEIQDESSRSLNKEDSCLHIINTTENRFPPRRQYQNTKLVRVKNGQIKREQYKSERSACHCVPLTDTTEDRCRTFLFRWPSRPGLWYPFLLAEAGFSYPYPCKGVEVQCHKCKIKTSVDSWSSKETPILAHYRLNSDCPFAKQKIMETVDMSGETHFQTNYQNGICNLPTLDTTDICKTKVTDIETDHQSHCNPHGAMTKNKTSEPAPLEDRCVNQTNQVQSKQNDHKQMDDMNSQLTIDAFNSSPDFKYPQYQSLSSRLRSFDKWTFSTKQSPKNLADAGYFYTGENDIVRCFCCDLGLAEWDPKDNPWVEHARHNPKCWFLENEKGKEFIDDIQKNWRKIYNPKHAAFDDKESRLATFEDWRTDIEQTAEILADAGFFYIGEEDIVRCHYCDGGLRHWEAGDVPWEEHARWFPFCKFVIKMKGREYIEEVKRKTEERQRSNTLQDEDQGHEGYSITYNTDAVKILHELGMKENDIIYAVSEYQRRRGNSNFTAEDLVELILEKEDTEKNNTRNTFKAMQSFSNIEKPEEKDPQKIREINRKLKEKMKCVRCRSNEISMLFVNCGHRITCENCADKMDFCPVCDTRIKKRIKTFLS